MNKILCHLSFLILFLLTATNASAAEPQGEITLKGEILPWSLTAAAFGISFALDRTGPWPSHPLIGGETDKRYHQDMVPGYWLYAGAGLMTGFISLVPNREGFLNRTSYVNVKGYVQAMAFTVLSTGITKNLFGRKRPSYDNFPSGEKEKDGRKSFVSGHTSNAFCTATYGSLFIWYHVGENRGPWRKGGKILAAAGLHSLAGWIGWTRVHDNRHHVSDVVAGGVLGTGVALVTFMWHNGRRDTRKPGDVALLPYSTGEMSGLLVSRFI